MSFGNKIRNVMHCIQNPISCLRFFSYLNEYNEKSSEKVRFSDLTPRFYDATDTTEASRNFYEVLWTTDNISKNKPKEHIDVGSDVKFVGVLSRFVPVTFVDIRPLEVDFKDLNSKKGTITELPFESDSVESISTLSVVEHIGLGRYGDPIDPQGSYNACRELARVLKKGGHLYFSVPIGKKRVCFNAHRIFSVSEILDYFNDLNLVEFSAIGSDKKFIRNADTNAYDNCRLGCGMFHFVKK